MNTYQSIYKSSVDQHVHNGEKLFECSICLGTFVQTESVTKHELIHTGEKPCECENGLKTFGRLTK